MPELRELPLELDADVVIRAQGGDPSAVRARRPDLVEEAERAIEIGLPLLEPRTVCEVRRVTDVRHSHLTLEGGAKLKGQFVARHLAAASEVAAILCTVGNAIEETVSQLFPQDPVLALALDAVGSAAVESLSVNAIRHFEQLAEGRGWGVSVPLSPGMEGWPVEEGQPQVFKLVPGEAIGVSLTPHAVMQPGKSLSVVLGLGPDVAAQGTICDYCAVRATCRYRGSHG